MLSFFLAKKIYSDSGETKKVSLPAVRIATLGMAIGLAVMIVSVAVVMGFKKSIRDKVVGFGSHLVVNNFTSMQDVEQAPICTSDSIINLLRKAPGVTHTQRYAMKQGLLKTDTDFLGVMLKGVGEDWDTTFISANMNEGVIPAFSSEKSTNKILISRLMADKLNVSVGEKIFAYFLGDGSVRTRRFTISGIYQTNLTKYDEAIVFCELCTAQRLKAWQPDQTSGIEMTVADFAKIETTAQWLIEQINRKTDKYGQTYSSATIQETNPQIFSWLDLLDLNVWIILALMICVASVTMISGLLIVILERIPMIGTLKALGARDKTIRHTFLWFGSFIIIKGIVWGNIAGLALCLIQKYTGLITLDPQTYYVSEAPVEISIPVVLLLNVCTLIVCTLILIVPSFLVSHIHPVKTMKFKE